MSRLLPVWCLSALVAVLVYWPGLKGGFAFDDYHVIVNNALLEIHHADFETLLDAAFSTATGPLKRPLALLSFAVDRSAYGLDPYAFKCTNLFLHIANAGLLLLLFRRLVPYIVVGGDAAGATRLATLATLAWTVHPLNLSSVLYVVQRMTLLSSGFVLLALLCFVILRSRQIAGQRVGYLLPGGLGLSVIAGLACKETAVLAPVYMLVLEFAMFDGAAFRRFFPAPRVLLAVFAVTLAVIGLATAGQMFPDFAMRGFSVHERVLTECRVLMLYVRMLLVPDLGLFALFHDDVVVSRGLFMPRTTLPSVVAVAAAAVCALCGRPRVLAFALAWFLGGHLLESTVVPLELMHEHRNYLPGAGILLFAMFAVESVAGRFSKRLPRGVSALLLIAVFAVLTHQRATDWADPWTQMALDVHHHPASARSWYEYGRLSVERAARTQDAELRQRGIAAIERSEQLSGAPTLAVGALLKLAANDEDEARTRVYLERAATHPSLWLRVDVLQQLIRCQAYAGCRAEPGLVIELATRILEAPTLQRYHRATVLEWLAIYYLRVLGDAVAGKRILAEQVAERPHDYALAVRYAEALAGSGEAEHAAARARDLMAGRPWYFQFSDRPTWRRLRALEQTP